MSIGFLCFGTLTCHSRKDYSGDFGFHVSSSAVSLCLIKYSWMCRFLIQELYQSWTILCFSFCRRSWPAECIDVNYSRSLTLKWHLKWQSGKTEATNFYWFILLQSHTTPCHIYKYIKSNVGVEICFRPRCKSWSYISASHFKTQGASSLRCPYISQKTGQKLCKTYDGFPWCKCFTTGLFNGHIRISKLVSVMTHFCPAYILRK